MWQSPEKALHLLKSRSYWLPNPDSVSKQKQESYQAVAAQREPSTLFSGTYSDREKLLLSTSLSPLSDKIIILCLIQKPEQAQTWLPRAAGSGRPLNLLSKEGLFWRNISQEAIVPTGSWNCWWGTVYPKAQKSVLFLKQMFTHLPSGENWSLSNMVIHRTSWYRSLMKNWQLKFHLGFKVSCRVLVV